MNIRLSTLHKFESHRVKSRLKMLDEFLSFSGIDPFVDTTAKETESFNDPVIKNKYNPNKINSYVTHPSLSTKNVLGKKIENFEEIIKKTGAKLDYVKSGSTGQTFKGVINFTGGEKFIYALKICAYPKCEKYGNYDNINRPENAEIRMLKVLSYFVVRGITPHLILPYYTFDTNIEYFTKNQELLESAKSSELYNAFLKKHKEGKFHKYVSVVMCEWANCGDFLDFIKKNYSKITPIMWKIFFFQILSVLAIIQNKYPSFRHNDLKANNVLVQEVPVDDNTKIKKYVVSGINYTIPAIKYQLKLWDFDFSCIPGVSDNTKVGIGWTKSLNIIPDQNRYYDVHYFFLSLLNFFGKNKYSVFPKEVFEFIDTILPKRLVDDKFLDEIGLLKKRDKSGKVIGTSKGKKINVCYGKGRLLKNEEFITPNEILKSNKYFEEFRTQNPSRDFYENLSLQPSFGSGKAKVSEKTKSLKKIDESYVSFSQSNSKLDGKRKKYRL